MVNNCNKLCILLWKNFLLQVNDVRQMLAIIIIAILALALILIGFFVANTSEFEENRYTTIDMSVITLEKPPRNATLLYSPNNAIYDSIVKSAAKKLNIEKYEAQKDAEELDEKLRSDDYLAGIEFDDDTANANAFPKTLSFALRFPSKFRTKDGNWNTNQVKGTALHYTEREPKENTGGVPPGYVAEGFVQLQNALVIAYLELSTNQTDLPQVQMQRYPYPKTTFQQFYVVEVRAIPIVILLLCYLYPCASIVSSIAIERQTQLKEVMMIVGLSNWLHWIAWFIKWLVILILLTALILIVLFLIELKHGTVLNHSDWSAVLIFLLVYCIATICFCFMLAMCFKRAALGIVVVFVIFFPTDAYFILPFSKFDTAGKLIFCLLPNTAFHLGFSLIFDLEMAKEGLQWSNMDELQASENLRFYYIHIMMIVGAIIYLLICLYLEQINTGEYGVPKKWNFIFKRNFWCPNSKNDNQKQEDVESGKKRGTGGADDDRTIGVEVKNLYKKFGNHVAVNGVSFNMYTDEIFVLLGHNGAGKTTTIMMITGMIPPDDGTAILNGYDIKTHRKEARHSLGICPQSDVVFESLTVKQHITFFCRLKGIRGKSAIKAEIDKYVNKMQLDKKVNVAARNLSGGMKRKLTLCCALCGDTRTVLCDEPSAGLDPSARRQLWELLESEKEGRTILLTTHFMDEADALGDNIAILCEGEVRASGTSFDLKAEYGSGYRLICDMLPDGNKDNVTSFLQLHLTGIQLESHRGSELVYLLPKSNVSKYSSLFRALENRLKQLKLTGFGVSVPSMEEVFLKVGEGKGKGAKTDESNKRQSGGAEKSDGDDIFSNSPKETSGCKRCCLHWRGIYLKRALFIKRNWVGFLLLFIIPVLFLIMICSLDNDEGMNKVMLDPLPIKITSYDQAIIVLESSANTKIAEEYENYANSFGGNYEFIDTDGNNFEDYILDVGYKNLYKFSTIYIVGATVSSGNIIAWLNNQPLHAAPLSLNFVHNAMARAYIGSDASVEVTNSPVSYKHDELEDAAKEAPSENSFQMLALIFCIVTAFFVFMPINERVTGLKQHQYLSGVSIFTYWMANYTCDLLILIVIALLLLIVMAAFEEFIFTTPEEFGIQFLICLLLVMALLAEMYVLSFCFKDAAKGVGCIIFINYTSFLVARFTLILIVLYGRQTWMEVLRILPLVDFVFAEDNLKNNYQRHKICKDSEDKLRKSNMPDMDVCDVIPFCCELRGYFDLGSPGMGIDLLWLFCIAAVCVLLIMLCETNLMACIGTICAKNPNKDEDKRKEKEKKEEKAKKEKELDEKRVSKNDQKTDDKQKTENNRKGDNKQATENRQNRPGGGQETATEEQIDEDVINEQERIAKLSNEDRNNIPLVVDRISKCFGKFCAVRGISFSVQSGECFGLLGVNGAGKTTSFQMLTGGIYIQRGNAYLEGRSIRTKFLKPKMQVGYCPQYNVLYEDMTGRENLRINSLVKGLLPKDILPQLDKLAEKFGFAEHIDKRVKNYNGGSKRKLCAALAMIGNPKIIYMDEPTTGLDPMARRHFWNVVIEIRETGKPIVLTSHSMEECEALCSRLGIMVAGKLRCLGSAQYLKNKFSKGIILTIKIQQDRRRKTTSITSGEKSRPTTVEKDSKSDAKDSNSDAKDSKSGVKDSKSGEKSPQKSVEIDSKSGKKSPQKSVEKDLKSREKNPRRSISTGGTSYYTPYSSSASDTYAQKTQPKQSRYQTDKSAESSDQYATDKDKKQSKDSRNQKAKSEDTSDKDADDINRNSKDPKSRIKKFVAENLSNPQIISDQGSMLVYEIPSGTLMYSYIFKTMEDNYKRLKIDHYTISQMSLDDVFLEFAKTPDDRK